MLTQFRDDAAAVGAEHRDGAPAASCPSSARLGGRRFGYAPRLRRYAATHRGRFDVVHAFSYHAPVALAVSGTGAAPLFFSPVFHAERPLVPRTSRAPRLPAARQARLRRAEAILCSVERGARGRRRALPVLRTVGEGRAASPSTRTASTASSRSRRTSRSSRARAGSTATSASTSSSRRCGVGDRATLVICGSGPDERARSAASSSAEGARRLGAAPRRRRPRTSSAAGSAPRRSSSASRPENRSGSRSQRASSRVRRSWPRTSLRIARWPAIGRDLTGVPARVRDRWRRGHGRSSSALAAGRPGPPSWRLRAWSDVARDTIAVYEDALARSARSIDDARSPAPSRRCVGRGSASSGPACTSSRGRATTRTSCRRPSPRRATSR